MSMKIIRYFHTKEPEMIIMDNLLDVDAIIRSYLMQELGIVLYMAEGGIEIKRTKQEAYLI